MNIRWTRLAKSDLEYIHAYISQENPKAAISAVAIIRDSILGQLNTSPFSGRVGRVYGTRELIVPRLPFIVVYRSTDAQLEIIRVLHTARQWPATF